MAAAIRPAEARDLEAITSFTTATFDWGDYVADNFLEWLDEPDTRVAVALEDGDRPVAVARVRMLGPREGWLSAARVHPDHRRRGLGSALNDWCVDWVRQRGGVVARLQIETWNEPAHNQVERLGYRPVASVVNAFRSVPDESIEPTTNGGRRVPAGESLDRSPRAETDGAYIAWSTSELARASHSLFPVEPWAWRRMTPDDTRSAPAWYCAFGWILAEEDESELVVRWLVSTPDDAENLVRATVDLAVERGLEDVHLVVPAVGWLQAALDNNGFESGPSRIYEKPL